MGNLKAFRQDGVDNPAPYIQFLDWTGQKRRAVEVTQQAMASILEASTDNVSLLVSNAQASENERVNDIRALRSILRAAPDAESRRSVIGSLMDLGASLEATFFNNQINISIDYASATAWYEEMRKADVAPDEVTFSTLINIAPDYVSAKAWYEEMRKADVAPNEFTFNTLINIAPDYASAKAWYQEMRKADVAPNEVTTTTLAIRCPNFTTAKELTDSLRSDEAFRGQGYYSAAFSKIKPDEDPILLIEWYFKQDFRHVKALEPAIKTYASGGRHDSAMELVVRWPQLAASERYMRTYPEPFSEEISRFLGEEATRPSALYALGLSNALHGNGIEALTNFVDALRYETHPSRKAHMETVMRSIRTGPSLQ